MIMIIVIIMIILRMNKISNYANFLINKIGKDEVIVLVTF